MSEQDLDALFDPAAQRCWLCRHCIYDIDKGHFCRKKQKSLGGNYEIHSPNNCNEYDKG